MSHLRSINTYFTGACFSGIIFCIGMWVLKQNNDFQNYDQHLDPKMSQQWIIREIFLLGAWGLVFLLPWFRTPWRRCLFFAGLYSFTYLFVLLPFVENKGFLGTELGEFMPVLILAKALLWSTTITLWDKYS